MWAPSRRRLEGVAFSFWVRGTWGHLRVLRCCIQGLSKAADGLTGSCLLHLGRLSRGLPAPSGDERGMGEQGKEKVPEEEEEDQEEEEEDDDRDEGVTGGQELHRNVCLIVIGSCTL